jgi:glycosyltransferase involved in cell wall biosynthesis
MPNDQSVKVALIQAGDRGGPSRKVAFADVLSRAGFEADIIPAMSPSEGGPRENERDYRQRLTAWLGRARPDVLVAWGDGSAREFFELARGRGIATVLLLDGFRRSTLPDFAGVDAVVVPTEFAARFHRESLGLDCAVLPFPVDRTSAKAEAREPRYVTFVDPTPGHGVYALARIADELGRRRPDISLLVVEGAGTEATLAGCGLDLPARGNVSLMAPTSNPKEYWGSTRICLLPSLGWENQPTVAVEAMLNGIPVIGSDRGGIPETLGGPGIILPLPDRITPATKTLPGADEVGHWVEAILRLWDDEGFYASHRDRALRESERWSPDLLAPRYRDYFLGVRPESPALCPTHRSRSRFVVLVPFLTNIEWPCERGLRGLEESGVRVVRRRGSSAIDLARNEMVSNALHDGLESILFVDSDIEFDPLDALRLLARPEPVVAGIYSKKGERGLTSVFANEIDEVLFGPIAPGLYPLTYAATGFLRIRAEVLRRMIDELHLPLCNTQWGRGLWPFFQPTIVPQEGDRWHYLGEDWSFSHRLEQVGVIPMADTSFRLLHWGSHGFGWEDAGADFTRYTSYNYRLKPGPDGG